MRGLEVYPEVWEETRVFDNLKRSLANKKLPLSADGQSPAGPSSSSQCFFFFFFFITCQIVNVNLTCVAEVPPPLGKFKSDKNKFDLCICSAEKGMAEAKLIHSNFEKRIKTTKMNLASSFDSIEEEISTSGLGFLFFFFLVLDNFNSLSLSLRVCVCRLLDLHPEQRRPGECQVPFCAAVCCGV